MAAPNNLQEIRGMNAQSQIPSRSAAVASNAGQVASAVDVLSVNAEFTQFVGGAAGPVIFNIRRTDYVLPVDPTTSITVNGTATPVIPNPQIGDRAFVFVVDHATTNRPTAYREWHYTGTAWQRVQYV